MGVTNRLPLVRKDDHRVLVLSTTTALVGSSERTHDLQAYETTADGECQLCHGCYESWNEADEIVDSVGVHSSAE